jgi:hypothetical protein
MDDALIRQATTAARLTSDELEALARALEVSWDAETAYRRVVQAGNRAYGQCYPTSRVVQWLYPEYEIARGEVLTPSGIETHFWNIHGADANADWIDFSWSQFPPGSQVGRFEVLDRHSLADSPATQARCELLRRRVTDVLKGQEGSAADANLMSANHP